MTSSRRSLLTNAIVGLLFGVAVFLWRDRQRPPPLTAAHEASLQRRWATPAPSGELVFIDGKFVRRAEKPTP